MKPGWNWCSQTWWLPGGTFVAVAAADDERHGDAIAGAPRRDLLADRRHDAGQFVARHMRQADAGVVAHPAMPVAAAEPGGLDLDDDAFGGGRRVGQRLDPRRLPEFLEETAFIVEYRSCCPNPQVSTLSR